MKYLLLEKIYCMLTVADKFDFLGRIAVRGPPRSIGLFVCLTSVFALKQLLAIIHRTRRKNSSSSSSSSRGGSGLCRGRCMMGPASHEQSSGGRACTAQKMRLGAASCVAEGGEKITTQRWTKQFVRAGGARRRWMDHPRRDRLHRVLHSASVFCYFIYIYILRTLRQSSCTACTFLCCCFPIA